MRVSLGCTTCHAGLICSPRAREYHPHLVATAVKTGLPQLWCTRTCLHAEQDSHRRLGMRPSAQIGNAPLAFTVINSSHSSSLVSSRGLLASSAALLTSTSSRPKLLNAVFTAAAADAASATLPWTKASSTAGSPSSARAAAAHSKTVAPPSRGAWRGSRMTSFAPSRANRSHTARPMPLLPPVTMQTFPESRCACRRCAAATATTGSGSGPVPPVSFAFVGPVCADSAAIRRRTAAVNVGILFAPPPR